MNAPSPRRLEPAPLVALVEDDPVMGQSIVDWLELHGYRVAWLRTGTEALSRLGALRPDLVVCDIRLPDTTGEEIHARTSRELVGTPFVFVTGHGEVDQAVRLMRAGAADYVTKPFEIEALLDRIATLLAPYWQQTDGAELGALPAILKVEGSCGGSQPSTRPFSSPGRAARARRSPRVSCTKRVRVPDGLSLR
jgi:DNA-binding response OmpR family regulator